MPRTELLQQGGPASGDTASQTDRAQRILVADDDPTMRALYTALLAPSGYQVDSAPDGAAAWEALRANHYDLLITDNSMPRLSGWDLLEKLRSACMTLPTIMVSGTLPIENSTLRISAVLTKPVSMEALLETVKEILRAGRTDASPPPPDPAHAETSAPPQR